MAGAGAGAARGRKREESSGLWAREREKRRTEGKRGGTGRFPRERARGKEKTIPSSKLTQTRSWQARTPLPARLPPRELSEKSIEYKKSPRCAASRVEPSLPPSLFPPRLPSFLPSPFFNSFPVFLWPLRASLPARCPPNKDGNASQPPTHPRPRAATNTTLRVVVVASDRVEGKAADVSAAADRQRRTGWKLARSFEQNTARSVPLSAATPSDPLPRPGLADFARRERTWKELVPREFPCRKDDPTSRLLFSANSVQ